MTPNTDEARLLKQTYHGWLSVERDALYWQAMAAKNDRLDNIFAVVTMVLGSAVVASFVANLAVGVGLPEKLTQIATGVFAIISAIITFTARQKSYGKKAARFAMMQTEAVQQARAWKELRDRYYEGDAIPAALVAELRSREVALATHESGHQQDNEVAAECEAKAREMAKMFEATIDQRKQLQLQGKGA